jgi:DNA-binding response OmpR family regulator
MGWIYIHQPLLVIDTDALVRGSMMNTPTVEDATVLVVDDERDIADLYSTWLRGEYTVRTAYGPDEALHKADSEVEVLFLDRQMPKMTGDEVLERIRDRGIGCRVVMVTAVDPDFDIVEMPFDDYLTKPVMLEELQDAVERMLTREDYDETVQEFFALSAKKATLESNKDPVELRDSDEYERLEKEVEQLRRQADTTVAELGDAGEFESLFHEFPGDA